MPIAFADALPFKRFGLTDTPALMLGMDTLKLFRRVQIDFANREIRLTLPKNAHGRPARPVPIAPVASAGDLPLYSPNRSIVRGMACAALDGSSRRR